MAKTPEGRVKDRVKSILANYPNLYYNMFVPGGFGTSGLDFTCCYHGRYFVIETKAGLAEPTGRQEKDMRDIVTSGGKAFVVKGDDPKTFRVLVEWLEHIRMQNLINGV